jgi:hypothetical protein
MTLRSAFPANQSRSSIALLCILAGLLILSGCGSDPVRPLPFERAYTAVWFTRSAESSSDWERSQFKEAHESAAGPEAIERFRALAKDGIPEAAYELGKAYRYSHGVRKDLKLAAQWFMAAVSRSNSRWPHASYHLGTMFLEGKGVPRNLDLARRLLQQAYENEIPLAAMPLARIYAEGQGVRRNTQRAAMLAHQSAKAGNLDAYLWLLRAYRPNGVLGRNPVQTRDLFKKAMTLAERQVNANNDPHAMGVLAMIHYGGLGRPKDFDGALGWLNSAARAGRPHYLVKFGKVLLEGSEYHTANPNRALVVLKLAAGTYRQPDAMVLIARAYHEGLGISRNASKARSWYERAIGLGSAEAQYEYGNILADQRDKPKAVARGAELLENAGRLLDHPNAWAKLGQIHLEKAFPGAIPSKGVNFLRRAHDAKVTYATALLGRAYLEGTGTKPDPRKAETLLRQAMDQGHAGALMDLARAYLDGSVLPHRPLEAKKLLESAVRKKLDGAERLLGGALLSGKIPGDPLRGIRIVTAFAQNGDTSAMMELGRAQRDGVTIPRNVDSARMWFRKAIDAGAPDAKEALGAMLFAIGTQGPPILSHLEEAAALGHAGAMSVLGTIHLKGDGVDPNPVVGAMWLQRAAAQGNLNAAATLGMAYINGAYGLDREPETGRQFLQRAAYGNNVIAMRELAKALIAPKRKGIPRDPEQGLEWLRNAATQGDAEAMRILGVTYLQGMKGINPNQENAKIWLTRAAEKGEVSALTALGGAYLDGKGLPRRPRTGLHYLERAARAGDDTALAYLGSFYMNERFEDEAPDRTKGFKYLQAAVRKGNVGAMAALGRAYINGDLGDRQIKKGTRMLVKAAQRGHESARYALAEAYLQAQGLEKANRDYAQAWLQSVIAGDSELAVQTLAEMLADSDIRIPEIHAERGATLIGDRRRSPGGR